VDVLEHRARQFQLARRLERDIRAFAFERDDLSLLFDGNPAEARQPTQHRLDATIALVGGRTQVVEAETEFLVLGADLPLAARPAAGRMECDQLVEALDRQILFVAGSRHRVLPWTYPAEVGAPRAIRKASADSTPQPGYTPGERGQPWRN